MDKKYVNEYMYYNPRFTKKSGEVIMFDNEKEIINRIVENIAKNPRFKTSNLNPILNPILSETIARFNNG